MRSQAARPRVPLSQLWSPGIPPREEPVPGVALGRGLHSTAWLVPRCRHGPWRQDCATIVSLVPGAGTQRLSQRWRFPTYLLTALSVFSSLRLPWGAAPW